MCPLDHFLNSQIKGCDNFKWKEALSLPSWDIAVFPNQETQDNIISIASKLEKIRLLFGKPLIVTSWYRPEKYNSQVGGSKNSYHMKGLAVDFYIKGITSDEVREVLERELVRLNIRMEKLPGANWVHVDMGNVKIERYFRP